jgi:hypothetical protein
MFFLNWVLWPFLKVSWELVSKKRSHWWHWKSYKGEVDMSMCVLDQFDSKAKPRTTPWSNLWQTNFGWKLCVVMEPHERIPFRIGFVTSDKTELCSVLVKNHLWVAALSGPDKCSFFALDERGKQIPLRFVKIAHKDWMPRKTLLL